MKPELFLLGLMEKELEKKNWNFVTIYVDSCKTIVRAKMEGHFDPHHGRMVAEVDGVGGNGKTDYFG